MQEQMVQYNAVGLSLLILIRSASTLTRRKYLKRHPRAVYSTVNILCRKFLIWVSVSSKAFQRSKTKHKLKALKIAES